VTANPTSAMISTRNDGTLRRAASSAADSEPIAMIDPSSPYSAAPLWNTWTAISALVIWKFMQNVPKKNTITSKSRMRGSPRT